VAFDIDRTGELQIRSSRDLKHLLQHRIRADLHRLTQGPHEEHELLTVAVLFLLRLRKAR
jgi:hypothetical protein